MSKRYKNYRIIFLFLLCLTMPYGCDYEESIAVDDTCDADKHKTINIALDKNEFLDKYRITETKVTDEDYALVINATNFIIEINPANGALYIKKGDRYLFRTFENIEVMYFVKGILFSPNGSQSICSYNIVYYGLGTLLLERTADFKIDSTNPDHWYLYYDNSWWLWDVTKLYLNWLV